MVHNHNSHGVHQSLTWLWILIGLVIVLPMIIIIIWVALAINMGEKIAHNSCDEGRKYWCRDEINYDLCHDDTDPSYKTSCCTPGKAQWIDWGLPADEYAMQCS